MTHDELKALIETRESANTEFKPAVLSRKEIAEYAVGIGNAGGGRLVMGVSDKPPRRILGIPEPAPDEVQRIRESVADSAQIHLDIEIVRTPDGPVVVAWVPARPRGVPLHTRDGKYLVRLGDELRGLTVAEIDAIRQEAGVEFTAQMLPGEWRHLVRPAGMEELRNLMREANAPADLLKLDDVDLLRALGLLSEDGRLLLAGMLLVGQSEPIRDRVPSAQWHFFRMLSETDYDLVERGYDCITVALRRLRDLVNANNPIVTFKGPLVHPEFPRYPPVAVRELLVNALVHRDYRALGNVTVKLYPHSLEITNAGGFPGDVTPQNILHHASIPRNPALFAAVSRMRLANAANLGVQRVFRDLLVEGKEPPRFRSTGQTVFVTVKGQDARREFVEFVRVHPDLDGDGLLVVHRLTQQETIDARETAEMAQRSLADARELLGDLVSRWHLLEAAGKGRGRHYRLSREASEPLAGMLAFVVHKQLGEEKADAKTHVLAALAEESLSNADIRRLTQLGRYQSVRLLDSLRRAGAIELRGRGRNARWYLRKSQ
jgi:ATP-dependent DNA helicase RecG